MSEHMECDKNRMLITMLVVRWTYTGFVTGMVVGPWAVQYEHELRQ